MVKRNGKKSHRLGRAPCGELHCSITARAPRRGLRIRLPLCASQRHFMAVLDDVPSMATSLRLPDAFCFFVFFFPVFFCFLCSEFFFFFFSSTDRSDHRQPIYG